MNEGLTVFRYPKTAHARPHLDRAGQGAAAGLLRLMPPRVLHEEDQRHPDQQPFFGLVHASSHAVLGPGNAAYHFTIVSRRIV